MQLGTTSVRHDAVAVHEMITTATAVHAFLTNPSERRMTVVREIWVRVCSPADNDSYVSGGIH